MRYSMLMVAAMVLAACGQAAMAADIMPFGYRDTFSDGTVMGWAGGSTGTEYTFVPTGGPKGTGDGYLRIDADMSHLGTKNEQQWGGRWWQGEPRVDLAASGITCIATDLKNLGTVPVDIRMVITGGNGGGGRWVYTDALHLEPGTDWTRAYWQLDATRWTNINPGTFSKLLTDVGRISIHNDPGAPDAHGGSPDVTGALGVDNVAAIPEPATMIVLSVAGLAALRRRRR